MGEQDGINSIFFLVTLRSKTTCCQKYLNINAPRVNVACSLTDTAIKNAASSFFICVLNNLFK